MPPMIPNIFPHLPGTELPPELDEAYHLPESLDEVAGHCEICDGPLFAFSNAGVAYCQEHWPYDPSGMEGIEEGQVCVRCGEPAGHRSTWRLLLL